MAKKDDLDMLRRCIQCKKVKPNTSLNRLLCRWYKVHMVPMSNEALCRLHELLRDHTNNREKKAFEAGWKCGGYSEQSTKPEYTVKGGWKSYQRSKNGE